jgi:hypothetical protein
MAVAFLCTMLEITNISLVTHVMIDVVIPTKAFEPSPNKLSFPNFNNAVAAKKHPASYAMGSLVGIMLSIMNNFSLFPILDNF